MWKKLYTLDRNFDSLLEIFLSLKYSLLLILQMIYIASFISFISLVDFEIILKLLNKISIRKYLEILKNNLPNHRQNHRHPCKDIDKLLHLEFEFVLRPPMYVAKLLKKNNINIIIILVIF